MTPERGFPEDYGASSCDPKRPYVLRPLREPLYEPGPGEGIRVEHPELPTHAELDDPGWSKFLATMSPEGRAVAERFPPVRRYRIKATGEECWPCSYFDDGTLSVVCVEPPFGFKRVFGLRPNDLEE